MTSFKLQEDPTGQLFLLQLRMLFYMLYCLFPSPFTTLHSSH